MKQQYDNRTMTPPEDKPSKSELDQDGFEQSALKYVQALYKVDEVYDLYEHDREVAKRFIEWSYKAGYRYDDKRNYYYTFNMHPNDHYTFEKLWEIFCNVGNVVYGTENKNQ